MSEPSPGPYFTKDWFSPHAPVWAEILAHLRGRPDVRVLEIGAFEGRATRWMLEHLLTGPDPRIDVVDTFAGSLEHQPAAGGHHAMSAADLGGLRARFENNVAPWRDRVAVHQAPSHVALRTLPLGSFDLVYVDGSHRASDVLEDAVLAFRLLRAGGTMIFDDYEWNWYQGTLDHPAPGVDAFLAAYAGQYAVVHRGYQVAIRKT